MLFLSIFIFFKLQLVSSTLKKAQRKKKKNYPLTRTKTTYSSEARQGWPVSFYGQCLLFSGRNWLNQSNIQEFLIDPGDIDMKYFILLNNYGLLKYILKQNIELPIPQNTNLLSKNKYFSGIKLTSFLASNKYDSFFDKQIKSKILVSSRVLSIVQKQTFKRLQIGNKTYQTVTKQVIKQTQQIINQIVGELKPPVIRFMAWTLHKLFKQIYEKIYVNSQMLNYLKSIQDQRKIPIVFLPTHRSYIDFLIVTYICFVYNLKLPYVVSNQALMDNFLIPFLIRSSGAFLYPIKKFTYSQIYKVIFNQYVQRLLINGNNLQFFIEGSRSRTGKIQPPHSQILQILIQTLDLGMISDICLVPITINYEKVVEDDRFSAQLLGKQKVQSTLLRAVKVVSQLKVNFGKVYVQFSDPFFLKSYLQKGEQKQHKITRSILSKQLGQQIIYILNQKSVIMSTGIVSAVLLMYKKGIQEDQLIKTVNQLVRYIVKKGFKIGNMNQSSSIFSVRNAIKYLQTIITTKKRSIFQLQISAGIELSKALILSYYRNTIAQVFLPEAYVGCTLMSFGVQLYQKEGVSYTNMKQQTIFLMQVLSLEYFHPFNFVLKPRQFNQTIDQMIKKSLIKKYQQKYLILNSLLRPAIECYWSIVVYLLTKINKQQITIQATTFGDLNEQMQWFIESLYKEGVLDNYESCSLQIIKNCLKKYQEMKIIILKQISKNQARIFIQFSANKLRQLQTHLNKFLKNIYRTARTSPVQQAKLAGVNLNSLSKL